MKICEMSVELLDVLGTDISVVNAARVSFHKESDWEYEFDPALGILTGNPYLAERDVKLINYLAKHNHWSPFAHAFLSFRVKAPIFVARQAAKHQVGLAWNEVSRRYVDEEPEFWFPKEWRGRPENMKQGSSGVLDEVFIETDYSEMWSEDICYFCLQWYLKNVKNGMAPEQARMVLPQNTMTEWIWSGSLAAFCRVCKLRLDPHAQLEIQELVGPIAGHLEACFPVSYKAMMEN